MAESKSIGEMVRCFRGQMGLTQEKLAAQIGVSFSTLNRWENGHTQPSPLALAKIEQLLKQFNAQNDGKNG